MSGSPGSLLGRLQHLLERTYRMHTGELDACRFVIGNRGYRRIYADVEEVQWLGSWPGAGARTLVRSTPEGLRACIYYPDALIETLEAHPPHRGLSEHNVDAFATLVEELDHLLCIAEGAVTRRPVSLFELELHANVSKYLVLARFLAGRRHRLGAAARSWLRFHLFEKVRFCDEDPEVRTRYRDATRWAVRLLDGLRERRDGFSVETLRRFHAAGAAGKVRLIENLAA